MCEMWLRLFYPVWNNEFVPRCWREVLTVSIFRKGDMEDPGNYRSSIVLNLVGKLYIRVINNH